MATRNIASTPLCTKPPRNRRAALAQRCRTCSRVSDLASATELYDCPSTSCARQTSPSAGSSPAKALSIASVMMPPALSLTQQCISPGLSAGANVGPTSLSTISMSRTFPSYGSGRSGNLFGSGHSTNSRFRTLLHIPSPHSRDSLPLTLPRRSSLDISRRHTYRTLVSIGHMRQ